MREVMERFKESETLELKERWTDRALEDLAAFPNRQGGFRVTFLKDPYTPERLRKLGLNERQIRIIAVLRSTESASVSDLHRWFPDVSSKTIQRDLQALVKRGLVKALGDKKGRRYVLAR